MKHKCKAFCNCIDPFIFVSVYLTKPDFDFPIPDLNLVCEIFIIIWMI